MFKPQMRDQRLLGWSCEWEDRFFFFGSKHTLRSDLPLLFPNFTFCFLKQVRVRSVVTADPRTTLEADAHVTRQPGLALVSQSADCVPILLSSPQMVCAVHAGWRGVAANIVEAVHLKHPEFTPNFAAIGPHILEKSFEVGPEVAILLGGHNSGQQWIDLNTLVRKQLKASFGDQLRMELCVHDTVTHPDLNSYRRDREHSGRQFSFVVIKA